MKELVILDLECTCWEPKDPTKQMEIIEIGAVKMELSTLVSYTGEFQRFIRPILNPELSDFCKRLTTIKQEDIDQASSFPVVIEHFRQWLGNRDLYLFSSWGKFDRNQLVEDCILHEEIFPFINNHLNLKTFVQKMLHLSKAPSVGEMMGFFRIKQEGVAHRALNDVYSIVQILIKTYGRNMRCIDEIKKV